MPEPTKSHVNTSEKTTGTFGFSEQEKQMKRSSYPPKFGLAASPAQPNPGDRKSFGSSVEINVPGVPKEAIDHLKSREGVRNDVYKDARGFSAGMGHYLSEAEKEKFPEGSTVSDAQISEWAKKDISSAWNAANTQCGQLGISDQAFTIALFSVNYQLGTNWYTKHVKTWTLMKEKQWELAAVEAADSAWYRQTPNRVHDFQNAMRALSGGNASSTTSNAGGIADPFRKKVAEAKSQSQTPNQQEGKSQLAGNIADPFRKKVAEAKAAAQNQPNIKSPTSSPVAEPQGVERIKIVQTKLKALGLYSGAIDGLEFRKDKKESGTTKGIKAFQQQKGLAVTGVCDSATFNALQAKPANTSKGIADPFRKKVEEAKEKAAKTEDKGWGSDKGISESTNKKQDSDHNLNTKGNTSFVPDKFFVSQNSNSGKLPNPYASKENSGGSNCRFVASEMLISFLKAENPEALTELGLSSIDDLQVMGENANFLHVLEEDKTHIAETQEKANFKDDQWLIESDQAAVAIAYIEKYLKRNIPVLVGVDHTFNRSIKTKKASKTGSGYNEGTTDHFITLTGIGKFDDGTIYYNFFDPGRDNPSGGAAGNQRNKLVNQGGCTFKTSEKEKTGSSNSQVYHLSMVVLFPNDRPNFQAERESNTKDWRN